MHLFQLVPTIQMWCSSSLWLLLLCSLLLAVPPPLSSAATTAAAAADPQPLAPFDYINGQLIDLDTGVKLYRLAGLKPSTGYEVRVSFPATIPATIKFALVGPPAAAADGEGARAPLQRPGRRLLDCEKLIFTTDTQGGVQGLAEPHLELRALRRSVHRDGPKAGAPKLVYNIVLAQLVAGLPLDSIPTVITLVGVVLVALLWSLLWSYRLFPRVLDYLTADGSSSSSSSLGTAAAAATTAGSSRGRGGKRRA